MYRSNGGDECNMKRVRQILSKVSGRIAVVFKKKGSSELLGFTTDKQITYLDWHFNIPHGYNEEEN